MSKVIGSFHPLNSIHKAFEVAALQPSNFMQEPGYSGVKTDGHEFHVFTEHWKWVPAPTKEEINDRTRQEIVDLISRECGAQGDMIRQLATTLVNHGYRKFEIVEEDV